MTPAAVVTAMRQADVVAEVRGSAVHLRAPRGVLTPDLTTAIAAQKAEVAALLRLEGGAPDPNDYYLWRAIYAEVGTWPAPIQRLYFDRAAGLERRLGSPEAAEIQSFGELREAAVAPSPACWLRAHHSLEDQRFEALCRRTIGRPAPSTTEEDARVAAEILRRYGSQP